MTISFLERSADISIAVGAAMPAHDIPRFKHHSTFIAKLSEWLLNSGAYMHWMFAIPLW